MKGEMERKTMSEKNNKKVKFCICWSFKKDQNEEGKGEEENYQEI